MERAGWMERVYTETATCSLFIFYQIRIFTSELLHVVYLDSLYSTN